MTDMKGASEPGSADGSGVAAKDIIGRAVTLSWLTIGYNIVEGLVSVLFGVSEGSVALAGFGLDSFIEVGSAMLVLWRFRSETGLGPAIHGIDQERKATAGIGILFILLSILTAIGAVYKLVRAEPPDTAVPGFVISAVSLTFMYYLYSAKRKVAIALDSATVLKDANCSMACIKLSAVLFAGSLLNLAYPAFWWADPVAAAFLAVLIGNEGWETVEWAFSPDFSGGCGCVD